MSICGRRTSDSRFSLPATSFTMSASTNSRPRWKALEQRVEAQIIDASWNAAARFRDLIQRFAGKEKFVVPARGPQAVLDISRGLGGG